jgi:hypothetical protein
MVLFYEKNIYLLCLCFGPAARDSGYLCMVFKTRVFHWTTDFRTASNLG